MNNSGPSHKCDKNAEFEQHLAVYLGKKNILFDISFPSAVIGQTHQMRTTLRRALIKENFSQNFENSILLCVTEILTNIYRHAKDKGSEIRCCIYEEYDGRMLLCVLDNGTPFHDFVIQRRQSIDRLDSQELHTEGFGLGLISVLFPDHDYRPYDNDDVEEPFNTFIIDLDIHVSEIKKPRVFVVDDDPSLCELLKTYLSKSYDVRSFACAQECLDIIETDKPDLIVSDLHMPDIDGVAFRKKLDALPGCATIPFVFLSGNKEAAGKAYVNRLGIDDYLFKPVRRDALLQTLERLMTRSRQLTHGIQDTVGRDITFLLKPALPEKLGRWSAAVVNTMAGHGGGDFVVHRELESGHLVILADVMGKGVQAKFFACAYAGYLRSFFQWMPDIENSPARMMDLFSEYVAKDDLFQDVLVTCQIAMLKDDGSFSIVSAGHPLPHIIGNGKVEQIPVYGPLPGLVGKAGYQSYDGNVSENEKILLNTDGLIESTDLSYSYIDKIKLPDPLPIKQKAEMIWNVLDHLEPNAHPDDKTLVLLEYV